MTLAGCSDAYAENTAVVRENDSAAETSSTMDLQTEKEMVPLVQKSEEYYGSEPFERAYQEIYSRYEKKAASYFADGGVTNQHGGGGKLFCHDPQIMGWLFENHGEAVK